jgi:hypothetical protein
MPNRLIELTQGKVAIVDAADYEWLSQWKWYAKLNCGHWYACRKGYDDKGKRYDIFMHRVILDAPKGMLADHINGDGLDNSRSNLRLATSTENNHNRRTSRNNRSGFKGVWWSTTYQKWGVSVSFGGKQRNIGYFDDLIKAAFARDVLEVKHHGEFAKLNFPEVSHS